jgi:hypothetical protein
VRQNVAAADTISPHFFYRILFMMNKEIILEVKNVYGNELIYPSCHIANALIKLKDKKTFNKSDLDVFKSLGMNITWKARTI